MPLTSAETDILMIAAAATASCCGVLQQPRRSSSWIISALMLAAMLAPLNASTPPAITAGIGVVLLGTIPVLLHRPHRSTPATMMQIHRAVTALLMGALLLFHSATQIAAGPATPMASHHMGNMPGAGSPIPTVGVLLLAVYAALSLHMLLQRHPENRRAAVLARAEVGTMTIATASMLLML